MKSQILLVLLAVAFGCGSGVSSLAAAEFSIPLQMDAGGQPLDGAAHRYTITFAAGDLPPARDWELVLFNVPEQDYVTNAIDRHSIESRMLPGLVRDQHGNVTIYIQHDPPREKLKANWLPAADGPFMMQLRMFGPKSRLLDAAWEVPTVERLEQSATVHAEREQK